MKYFVHLLVNDAIGQPAAGEAGDPPAEQCCWECDIQRATLTSLCARQFVEGLYAQDRAIIAAIEGVANAMRVSGFRGSVEGSAGSCGASPSPRRTGRHPTRAGHCSGPESTPGATAEGCRNPRTRLDGQCVSARQMGKEFEVRRKSTIDREMEGAVLIAERDRSSPTAAELAANEAALRRAVLTLWQTNPLRSTRLLRNRRGGQRPFLL